MKLNSINVNFGKRLIANCTVKNAQREKHSASLYEYDPWNVEDIKEIENSPHTGAISYDFYKAGLWGNHSAGKFYAVRDNETQEITSSCEITHHLKGKANVARDYIQINELQGNKRYIDSLTPLMSFISDIAQFSDASSIITTENAANFKEIKDYKFDEVLPGIYIMSNKKFEENIIKGEHRNQIDYNV